LCEKLYKEKKVTTMKKSTKRTTRKTKSVKEKNEVRHIGINIEGGNATMRETTASVVQVLEALKKNSFNGEIAVAALNVLEAATNSFGPTTVSHCTITVPPLSKK